MVHFGQLGVLPDPAKERLVQGWNILGRYQCQPNNISLAYYIHEFIV